MFDVRNLDILALSKTKVKGKRVEWFENVQGIKSSVSERTRAKEGVALSMRNELWDYCIGKEWK